MNETAADLFKFQKNVNEMVETAADLFKFEKSTSKSIVFMIGEVHFDCKNTAHMNFVRSAEERSRSAAGPQQVRSRSAAGPQQVRSRSAAGPQQVRRGA